jgi:hypothetical protein
MMKYFKIPEMSITKKDPGHLCPGSGQDRKMIYLPEAGLCIRSRITTDAAVAPKVAGR